MTERIWVVCTVVFGNGSEAVMTTFTGGALEVGTEEVVGSFSRVEVRFRFDSNEGRFRVGWVAGGNAEVVTEPS